MKKKPTQKTKKKKQFPNPTNIGIYKKLFLSLSLSNIFFFRMMT